MGEKLPCDKHAEQIKTLFENTKDLRDIKEVIHSLDKNMALQTQLLQNVVEYDEKQDRRMDEQQKTIEKINDNLTELTEGQRRTNEELKSLGNRIDKVEHKVKNNEEKHSVDLRDVNKKKYIERIFTYAIPSSGITIVLLKIIEMLISK